MTTTGRKRLLAIVVTVGLLVGWFVILPRYIWRFFHIPTAAMAPTLPVGCHVVVHPTKDVHRGDIAVFAFPRSPKIMNAKRLVAGPGDTVEIRDKKLIVNGTEVNEPYVIHEDPVIYPKQLVLPEPYRSRDQYGPYSVPAGSYFALGDNRDRTADSRYFGAIPSQNVVGRVVFVITTKGISRPR